MAESGGETAFEAVERHSHSTCALRCDPNETLLLQVSLLELLLIG